ncbi:Aldolase-type TIM barrel family protein, partial [Prunus dulcis]
MASISKLSNPSPASSLSSTFNPRASQPKCLIGFLTTTTNFSSKVSSSKLSIRSKSSLKGSLVVRCSQGDGNGNPAKRTYLHDLYEKEGQSPWYDNLCRPVTDLLPLIASGVRGVTSNPAIFQKAISTSNAYNDQFRELVQSGKDIESAYWELVVKDIQDASKLLISPKLADDTQGTVEAAKWLHKVVARPNVYIKIPATAPCIPSIKEVIANGISVNVTLIFSLTRYEAVIDAYLDGLEASGLNDLSKVTRWTPLLTSCLKRLELQKPLTFEEGAKKQRLLWASTSVKNPAYSDTLYVAPLIGPDTVSTMPDQALQAFIDHGTVSRTIDSN